MLRSISRAAAIALIIGIPVSVHAIPPEWLTWKPALTRQQDFDAFWSTATYQSALSSRPMAFQNSPFSIFDKHGRSTCRGQLTSDRFSRLSVPILHLTDWWADDDVIGPIEGKLTSHVTLFPDASKKNGWNSSGLPDKSSCDLVRAVLMARHSLRYLLSQPDATQARAGIVGEGYGGAIAIALAAMDPDLVAFVVIHEPVPGFHYLSDGTAADSRPILRPLERLKCRDSRAMHQAVTYLDFFNFAPAVTCPVFVTMGDGDPVATAEQVLSIYNNLDCTKELEIVADAGHLTVDGREEFYDLAARWLTDQGFAHRPVPQYRNEPGKMHIYRQ